VRGPLGAGRLAAAAVLALSLVPVGIGPVEAQRRAFRGEASYYAKKLDGNAMACGGRYRPRKMIAAHRTLPCGTRLKVRNRANGRVVYVTVKDRGPFGASKRILDLSRRAARRLHFINQGLTKVRAVVRR